MYVDVVWCTGKIWKQLKLKTSPEHQKFLTVFWVPYKIPEEFGLGPIFWNYNFQFWSYYSQIFLENCLNVFKTFVREGFLISNLKIIWKINFSEVLLHFFILFGACSFHRFLAKYIKAIMKQRWDRDSGESRRRRQRQERRKGHIYRERERETQTETGTETRTQIPREKHSEQRYTQTERWRGRETKTQRQTETRENRENRENRRMPRHSRVPRTFAGGGGDRSPSVARRNWLRIERTTAGWQGLPYVHKDFSDCFCTIRGSDFISGNNTQKKGWHVIHTGSASLGDDCTRLSDIKVPVQNTCIPYR